MTAPAGPDRTGVVARLDALEAAWKAATVPEPFWERCGCLAGLGEIPSVSDCHQAGLCAMRQRDHERDRAMSALLAAVRGVLALAETWTRYPQSPEDRERNRYGAAMEDCGNNLRSTVAAALGEA